MQDVFKRLTPEDLKIAQAYVGSLYRPADLVITTDANEPYLYRWHVTPRSYQANQYFHIQVSSDPERPKHDHPWPNMTVVLAGRYQEHLQVRPPRGEVIIWDRPAGSVVFREAAWAHRLVLPPDVPYTMTQFTTGPAREEGWGFWIGRRWYPHNECTAQTENGSVFRYPPGTRPRFDATHVYTG